MILFNFKCFKKAGFCFRAAGADFVGCRVFFSFVSFRCSLFCDVDPQAVIMCPDSKSIYDVPLVLENEKMDRVVCQKLGLKKRARIY